MVLIRDYKLRKINYSDVDAVMNFYSLNMIDSLQYLEKINCNSLIKTNKYIAVFYNNQIIAFISYDLSCNNEIKFDILQTYNYLDDFYYVIEYFKNSLYNKNITKFKFKLNCFNDSVVSGFYRVGFYSDGNVFINASSLLVINGSPTNGKCKKICDDIDNKYSNVTIIDAFNYNINSCIDCKYCSKNKCECCFDDMNDIYSLIERATNIVVVSPIYVGSVTPPLLAIFSRLQIYFANKFFLKNKFDFPQKQGFAIVVCGNDWEGQKDGVEVVMRHALYEMNANFNYYSYIPNNDNNGHYKLTLFYKELSKYAREKKTETV